MTSVKLCVLCEKPLDDDRRRRSDAVTCSRACRTALWRARRKARRTSGIPSAGVTGDGYASAACFEPPRPGALAADRASQRFRQQLEQHREASQPLSQEDLDALAWQRRNPGVLHPLLAARWVEAERERARRELAETYYDQPFAVQDPIHNPDPTVVARRGWASRQANRPVSRYDLLRPGPSSGPPPWGDSNECVNAPEGWRRGRC